jgi:hypothetical protein
LVRSPAGYSFTEANTGRALRPISRHPPTDPGRRELAWWSVRWPWREPLRAWQVVCRRVALFRGRRVRASFFFHLSCWSTTPRRTCRSRNIALGNGFTV